MADRVRFYIVIVLAILTVMFIFSQSALDKESSTAESGKVAEIVAPVLQPIVGEENASGIPFRKLAHLLEFGLLGIELAVLFKKFSAFPFLFTLLVGMTDETIQIFTGRGSRIQDVWIDFAGACCGIVSCMAIKFIVRKIKEKRRLTVKD